MGPITSIRAQMPVTDPAPSPALADQRNDQRQPRDGIAPVSKTTLPDAPQQVPAKPAAANPHLLAARDMAEAKAAATAEAARAAYIRASIEAGISPLPLP
ncbi:hypothetical protein EI545_00680 [Tabrizicola piscis]|uniref:Uncharacterized protein n=1 Tax=Tabrizicola piscis TaxID=2494374 RepID=A0A3S8U1R3_9RHOB|nr:hypothetical protein [Tabrizicola piscis]AZL57485.1 hypothetical protein EI545_00680 [Tabrizicola piscis]